MKDKSQTGTIRLVFFYLNDSKVLRPEAIDLFPFKVALKMLEPTDPGAGGRPSAHAEYRAAAGKWERDALEYATRAYLACRQELWSGKIIGKSG